MNKRGAIEEMIEQMSWYAFKDGESDKGVEKIARELYRNISTAHPDFTPQEVLRHWDTGKWDEEKRPKSN